MAAGKPSCPRDVLKNDASIVDEVDQLVNAAWASIYSS
jgi:hypothetical protein